MSTQVQLRKGTQAENDAFTGALGETTVDTTNDRLVVHDATTLGGHPSTSAKDVQNNIFTAAAGALSAGVYSATIPKVTAYANRQKFLITPDASNAGAVDININSLGAKNIYKHNGTGSLVELVANDIRANIPFEVVYNGTDFIAQISASTAAGRVLIATSTPTGVTSVTFSSIPQTYRELLLEFKGLSAVSAISLQLEIKSSSSRSDATFQYKRTTTTITDQLLTSQVTENLTTTAAGTTNGFFRFPDYTALSSNGFGREFRGWVETQAGVLIKYDGSFDLTPFTDLGITELYLSNGNNFDAGTINLWGIL